MEQAAATAHLDVLDKYRPFLEEGTYEGQDWSSFALRPKSRYETMRVAFSRFVRSRGNVVVELGTTRSFCGGASDGCNRDEPIYWEPERPELWDWGAGSFTRVAAEALQATIHTVDVSRAHIERCKRITRPFARRLRYHVRSSEDFLRRFRGRIDLLYMDSGDITPLEPTAQLQLREVHLVVSRGLIRAGGLVLVDDVQNQTARKLGDVSALGKGKYSIPFLLAHGFEVLEAGYQYLLINSGR